MELTELGNTGVMVSVAGLGCGGNSRIGLGRGASTAESIALVHEALDLGVNFLDTARAYGTENIVGQALADGRRDKVVLSTKARIFDGDELARPEHLVASLETSLRELGTDYVDVFHLHGVPTQHYEHARDTLAPALLAERDKGKLRFVGITELASGDPNQEMLSRAVTEPPWQVIMCAFHMMHQVARQALFPTTTARGIGTLMMFVVRNIFSSPEVLTSTVEELIEGGQVNGVDPADPLAFLIHENGASSVTEAAYRFVRHEPGVDVVLFGTGRAEHLRSNIQSILKPPLPDDDTQRLYTLFENLRGVGLDLPDHIKKARG
jgi:aryl-alcohol dehydrogenase-like predicted oxidoreductase